MSRLMTVPRRSMSGRPGAVASGLVVGAAVLVLAAGAAGQGRTSGGPLPPARLDVEPSRVEVIAGAASAPLRLVLRSSSPFASSFPVSFAVDLPGALRGLVTIEPSSIRMSLSRGATEGAIALRFVTQAGAPEGSHAIAIRSMPAPGMLVAGPDPTTRVLLVVRRPGSAPLTATAPPTRTTPPGPPGPPPPGASLTPPGLTASKLGAPGLLPPPKLWLADCAGKKATPDCRLSRPKLMADFGWESVFPNTLDWRWQVATQAFPPGPATAPAGLAAQAPIPKKGMASQKFFPIDFGKVPPLVGPSLKGKGASAAATQPVVPGGSPGGPSAQTFQALPCPPGSTQTITTPEGQKLSFDPCAEPSKPGQTGPLVPLDPPVTFHVRIVPYQGGVVAGPPSNAVTLTYAPAALAELWGLEGGKVERPALTLRMKWKEAGFRKKTFGALPAGLYWRWQLADKPFTDALVLKPVGLLSEGPQAGSEFTLSLQAYLDAPKDLYVRVVPVDKPLGGFGLAGTASNQVVVHYDPFKPEELFPEVRVIAWQPPRGYDWKYLCWRVATRAVYSTDGKTKIVSKGQQWNACQKEDGTIVDDIGEIVEGFVDAFKALINWASARFDDLKSEVVNAVAGVLQSTVGCPEWCKDGLKAALEAGLLAVGIPPEIPDFDQVMKQLEQGGVEFLATELVAAAGAKNIPLSQEAAELAIQTALDKAKQAAAQGSGPGAPLWIPNPDLAYRPASLVLELRNPSLPVPVQVDALRVTSGGKFKPVEIQLHGLVGKVAVPGKALAPGEVLKIPVFLTPTEDPEAWRKLLPGPQDLASCWDPFKLQECQEQKQKPAKDALAAWHQHYDPPDFKSAGLEGFTVTLTRGATEIKPLAFNCELYFGATNCWAWAQWKQPASP